jgi:small-conductance mechanosensitive channel
MDLMTGKTTSATMWKRDFAFAEGDQWFCRTGPLQLWAGAFPAELRLEFTRGEDRLEVTEVLGREGIEIPFPHRSLYARSATEPFPIRVIRSGEIGR